MVTDSLPTELHNDFLSGNVSSPKDECQKFSKTYEKKVNNINLMKNLHDNKFKVFDIKRQPFEPK